MQPLQSTRDNQVNKTNRNINDFLPLTHGEMKARGWDSPDIVMVTGDAYVDHPSFGIAIISRLLEAEGFRVCVVAQPQKAADLTVFGKPKIGFFINGGNIDSMVSNYTVTRRPRKTDSYTVGGKSGQRPDRATIVYSNMAKESYPETAVIIGGLEASLRRFAHYDYWDDKVRKSILIDSGAELLVFGMGEKQAVEIAKRLRAGEKPWDIKDIRGTCYIVPTSKYKAAPCAECPSFEVVSSGDLEGKKNYAIASRIQQDEQDHVYGKRIIQRHGDFILVQNPPAVPLTTEEFDRVAELDYMRDYHPSYIKDGGVASIEEVKFSLIHTRGCFGACNFCSIAFHQGRHITTRSEESLLREAKLLTEMEDFKGYIHDVGGPTANFRHISCQKQVEKGLCKGKKCLAPKPCKALEVDHSEYLSLLRKLRELPWVKKVFIRSGIRFDYLMLDKDERFFKELVTHHVSGQLKIAPEHCSKNVLDHMGKPSFDSYLKFKERFYEITKGVGKKQYLVPYLMSSHPGSKLEDAVNLAVFLKKENLKPEQVQDFYPTPGTIATAMFYTELNPYTMEKVFVPKTDEEKAQQRALLQYFLPQNKGLVLSTLKKIGRTDLIGRGKDCLVYDPSFQPSDRGQNQVGGKAGRSSGARPLSSKDKAKAQRKKSRYSRKKG